MGKSKRKKGCREGRLDAALPLKVRCGALAALLALGVWLWLPAASAAPPTGCTDNVPAVAGAPLAERACACSWIEPGAAGSTPKVLRFSDSFSDPVTGNAVKGGLIMQVGTPFVYNRLVGLVSYPSLPPLDKPGSRRTLSIHLGTGVAPNAAQSSLQCASRYRLINTKACTAPLPTIAPVSDSLFGTWQEIAGCGWTVTNSDDGYDTYENKVFVNWTDYFEGGPKVSSLSYPVKIRLPREVNVTTNTSLVSASGIQNLKATGFSIAFVSAGSTQMTVSLDYQLFTKWPHALTFASVSPPATSGLARVGNATTLDPTSSPAQCFAGPPSSNPSGLPVNSTATECWQSGRVTFTLPADACTTPNSVFDLGGTYLWQFVASCYPPTEGNVDQGFAVSDCRSTIVQAGTSILTAASTNATALNACDFAVLYTAEDSLSVQLKAAGNTTALAGDNRDTYQFGDTVQFVANVSSTLVRVVDVQLEEITVAKLGSVDRPTAPGTAGYNETMAAGTEGYGFPGFQKKLGQATGLTVSKLDNATISVSFVPNMGPSLEGYFLTTADDGQRLRFTFYLRFSVSYEAGSGGRRRIRREIRLPLQRRADVNVSLPSGSVASEQQAQVDIALTVGNVGGGSGANGTDTSGTPLGLGTGAIAGIAVGAAAGAALLAGVIVVLSRRKTKQAKVTEGEDGFLWQGDLERVADDKKGPPPVLSGLGIQTIANMQLPTDNEQPSPGQIAGGLPQGALAGLGAETLAHLVPPSNATSNGPTTMATTSHVASQLPQGALVGLGAETLAHLVAPTKEGASASAATTTTAADAPTKGLPQGALAGLGAATIAGLMRPTEGYHDSEDLAGADEFIFQESLEDSSSPSTGLKNARIETGNSAIPAALQRPGTHPAGLTPPSSLPSEGDLLAGLGAQTLANMVMPSNAAQGAVSPALSPAIGPTVTGSVNRGLPLSPQISPGQFDRNLVSSSPAVRPTPYLTSAAPANTPPFGPQLTGSSPLLPAGASPTSPNELTPAEQLEKSLQALQNMLNNGTSPP